MRKTKRVSLDIGGKPREFTVLEITVQQALDLYGEMTDAGLGLTGLTEKADTALPMFVEGITFEDVKAMAPSEIEAVWDEWREVNAAFFRVASFMKLDQLLEKLKEAIIMDFYALLCTSLAGGMSASGNMDGELS